MVLLRMPVKMHLALDFENIPGQVSVLSVSGLAVSDGGTKEVVEYESKVATVLATVDED